MLSSKGTRFQETINNDSRNILSLQGMDLQCPVFPLTVRSLLFSDIIYEYVNVYYMFILYDRLLEKRDTNEGKN